MKPTFPSLLLSFSLLLLFLLAACTTPAPTSVSVSSPFPVLTTPPISEATSLPLPSDTPTLTPAPTNTPVLTATPTLTPLEPLTTAPFMYFAGWSPDSRMLAYWTYTQEEVDSLPPENLSGYPPGVLHFYNGSLGTTCNYPQAAHYSFVQPTFAWQADGRAMVRGDDGVIRINTPCQDDFSTIEGTEAEILLGNPEFSLDGTYQAHAEINADNEKGIVTYHLLMTDLTTGQVVNSLDWQEYLALGTYTSPGGEWIRDDLFLIRGSVEQGPLLLQIGKEPIHILQDLFNLPGSCKSQGCDGQVFATAIADNSTGEFHVALWASGLDEAEADVLLYHSENGEVEALPFQYLHWPYFSPGGHWLLLDPMETAMNIGRVP